jgi:hypothetical protein
MNRSCGAIANNQRNLTPPTVTPCWVSLSFNPTYNLMDVVNCDLLALLACAPATLIPNIPKSAIAISSNLLHEQYQY